jgi:signal transduction histidine kinase
LRAYLLAIALIAASHVLIVGVNGLLGPATYTIFIAAVVLAAYFGGYGPSLLATVLASLDLLYTFLRPYKSFEIESENVMFLLAFLVVALVTSTLQAWRRKAEESLRRAHDELEQRVRDRTEELARSHRDILEIAEREQQRIGRDLHDGLGQELTGIAMLSTALAERSDSSYA